MISTLIYWPPWIGKSTVWALLAKKIWATHVDTDTIFISQYGDISQFIEKHKLTEFRKREWEILKSYLYTWNIVTLWWLTLSLTENQDLADSTKNTITLMTDMATIVARITNDTNSIRPLVQSPAIIEKLYRDRYNHYTQQGIVLNIAPLESPETVADKIEQLMIKPRILIPC